MSGITLLIQTLEHIVLTSTKGCDSLAYLNLTIKPVRESVFDTTICLEVHQ